MSDLGDKLRDAARRIDVDGTASQIVSADEMRELVEEADKLNRKCDNLLSYLNGISRQTAEMVKANRE